MAFHIYDKNMFNILEQLDWTDTAYCIHITAIRYDTQLPRYIPSDEFEFNLVYIQLGKHIMSLSKDSKRR
jgi:hypothetical protein